MLELLLQRRYPEPKLMDSRLLRSVAALLVSACPVVVSCTRRPSSQDPPVQDLHVPDARADYVADEASLATAKASSSSDAIAPGASAPAHTFPSGGPCPQSDEIAPLECDFGEADRHPYAVPETASRLWAGWCHHPTPSTEKTEPWLPPSLHVAWLDASSQWILDRCSWWEPSSRDRPKDLVIALARAGRVGYVINVYSDGRATFRSTCLAAAPVRERRISPARMANLIAALRTTRLETYDDFYGPASDSDLAVLAFYDGSTAKTIALCGGEAATRPLAPMLERIERTIADGTWIE